MSWMRYVNSKHGNLKLGVICVVLYLLFVATLVVAELMYGEKAQAPNCNSNQAQESR